MYGEVPESFNAIGSATSTSSHDASVLAIVTRSFAPISDVLLSGRVAMNGARPYESLPGFDLLTVAATKEAMNGGVKRTNQKVSKTMIGVSRTTKSSDRSQS